MKKDWLTIKESMIMIFKIILNLKLGKLSNETIDETRNAYEEMKELVQKYIDSFSIQVYVQ